MRAVREVNCVPFIQSVLLWIMLCLWTNHCHQQHIDIALLSSKPLYWLPLFAKLSPLDSFTNQLAWFNYSCNWYAYISLLDICPHTGVVDMYISPYWWQHSYKSCSLIMFSINFPVLRRNVVIDVFIKWFLIICELLNSITDKIHTIRLLVYI